MIMLPKNIIYHESGLKEPKNSCCQCAYFNRVHYIDHGLEENIVDKQDFCRYPKKSCSSDEDYAKLNVLTRCPKFEKSSKPNDVEGNPNKKVGTIETTTSERPKIEYPNRSLMRS